MGSGCGRRKGESERKKWHREANMIGHGWLTWYNFTIRVITILHDGTVLVHYIYMSLEHCYNKDTVLPRGTV